MSRAEHGSRLQRLLRPLVEKKRELGKRAVGLYGPPPDEEGWIRQYPRPDTAKNPEMRRLHLSHPLVKVNRIHTILSSVRITSPFPIDEPRHAHLDALRLDVRRQGLTHSLQEIFTDNYGGVAITMRGKEAPIPNELFFALGHCMLMYYDHLEGVRIDIPPGFPERNAMHGIRVTRSGFELPPDHAQAT